MYLTLSWKQFKAIVGNVRAQVFKADCKDSGDETGTAAAFVAEFLISFLIFFSLLVTYHSRIL